MAITKVSNASTNGATSLSIACSGNRPFLFVHVNTTLTSVTYNGIPLIKGAEVTGGWPTQSWYLFHPPTGTFNLVFSASTRAEAACFSNVSEATGILNPQTGSGTGTTHCTLNFSDLQAGDVVLGGVRSTYGNASLYSGTTIGGGTGYSNSAYAVSAGATAKLEWSGDDNKTASGFAIRVNDSIPSASQAIWFM